MRTLWIHAGRGKTGSSFLQKRFARHQQKIRTAGIAYPADPAYLSLAEAGQTTSGTGDDGDLKQRIAAAPDNLDVLINYEGFFAFLARDPMLEMTRWRHWMKEFGFDRIKVLLFIRDPIGHAGSEYLQAVRYNVETKTLNAFAAEYMRPKQVLRVVRAMQSIEWIDLTVLNYSVVRDPLWAETLGWLALQNNMVTAKPEPHINRALTRGEMQVLRRTNRASPLLARAMAREGLHMFPNLQTGPAMVPDKEAQQLIFAHNKEAMQAVNAQIAPAQAYRVDKQAPIPIHAPEGEMAQSALRMGWVVLYFILIWWALQKFKAEK